MNNKSIRVRFAPSPTGPLHIGGIRTALYNFLWAKQNQGTFILRIEDTDQKRFVPGAEEYIIDALRWIGITPDEGPYRGGNFGPYRQSQRQDIYQKNVQQLLESGSAYVAFDTPEELDAMRKKAAAEGVAAPKYDHSTRMFMKNSLTMDPATVSKNIQTGIPYVVRLKVEPEQTIKILDLIREEVVFQSDTLDDKVLLKADGLPTYHLANVVDDHLMQVSHVIRGEEWLPSTAHHILLYQAFGWDPPEFAHLPLILKPNGKGKLSKRDSDKLGIPVFPLEWRKGETYYPGFREKGFLPAAVINFLAFLGWNPGTNEEIFDVEELISTFSLDHVGRSGARFDFDKAKWYNHHYIQTASIDTLLPLVTDYLQSQKVKLPTERDMVELINMMRDRVHTIPEFYELGHYLFDPPNKYNERMIAKKWKEGHQSQLMAIGDLLEDLDSDDIGDAEQLVKNYVKEHQLKMGEIFPLLRIGITGDMTGPDLFQLINWLGPNETKRRISSLVKYKTS